MLVETGTPGIAAALALAFVSNLFATLTPYVCSSVFLRSGTFIAGHVISGLCTISCSFCWALHYCNRVVQGWLHFHACLLHTMARGWCCMVADAWTCLTENAVSEQAHLAH
eukprot:symbB.v1.2.004286.t1/scaffold220.1/size262620/10